MIMTNYSVSRTPMYTELQVCNDAPFTTRPDTNTPHGGAILPSTLFFPQRALENQVYILSLSRAGAHFGGSLLVPPWLSSPDGSDVVRLGDEEAALDLVVDTALLGRIREEFSFRADAHPALVDNDEGKVEGEADSGAEGGGVVGCAAANDKRGNALLEGEGKEAGDG